MSYRDYYPPGTSFRVEQLAASVTCPKCDETTTVTYEKDHSVGATSLTSDAVCENCGREFTDEELDAAELEPDDGGF